MRTHLYSPEKTQIQLTGKLGKLNVVRFDANQAPGHHEFCKSSRARASLSGRDGDVLAPPVQIKIKPRRNRGD
jgi:hypothetical protein